MKQFHEHIEWNKDEHERFEEVNRHQQEIIEKLVIAVFGNKEMNEKGLSSDEKKYLLKGNVYEKVKYLSRKKIMDI